MGAALFERWQRGTPPEELGRLCFAGKLVVFDGLARVAELISRVRLLLEQAYESDEPREAEQHLSGEEFRICALRARKAVHEDLMVRRHWCELLRQVGYAPNETWRDRIRLRIVPSRQDIGHRRIGLLPPHRDTWGSGIMAQLNWWLPLYPLSDAQTMLVWPCAFERALENDSADWSFERFLEDKSGTYPLLPTAKEKQLEGAVPILIHPGQLLAFSAAHLHASVSDESGRTRFSIDSRTVWEPDRAAGRSAPNADGGAQAERWNWYLPPLPE